VKNTTLKRPSKSRPRKSSELNRTGDVLPASENRYRDLFENANLAIFQSSVDGKIIAVNPAFACLFGYTSPEDVLS
jgi:PAS domain-containing protein